jgi:5-histidylcysteine sulfoxide synthase
METGVDEMSWDDLGKNEMEWPDVRRVTEYRRTIYGIVKDVILNGEWSFPIRLNDPAWAIVMGFEHERIHLETSSVLIRELPLHLVTRPQQFPPSHPSAYDANSLQAVRNELVPVAGGTVELGKPRDWPSFGWDNEYGERRVDVDDFRVSKFHITDAEFLDFVKAGGYTNESHWTEAGWQWRTFRNVLFPTFWVPDGPVGLHRYKLRLIFEVVDLPASWPVNVNAHEARAYCAWRTAVDGPEHPYRLVTEAEHHRMRADATRDPARGAARDMVMVYEGARMAAATADDNRYNLQLAWGSESPVDALPALPNGVHDSMGNVWTWTEDDFNPLDGFAVSPLYLDFSTPCFDGLHTVIMGGSFISTGDEASIFSRFHFRPHFNQHAGFRIVSSLTCRATVLPKQGTNGASASRAAPKPEAARQDSITYYETEALVNEYMLFHYGARKDVLPWDQGPSSALGFPARAARKASAAPLPP